jgi:hypothetical protein
MTRWLFFLLPVLFVSCGPGSRVRPAPSFPADSLIGEDLMVQILADVHTIEGGLQVLRNRGTRLGSMPEDLYNGLYRKYRISEPRFRENLAYYRTDPENFMKLYERVVQELKSRQQRFKLPGTKNQPGD